jgi:hypothetical protein
MTHRATKISLKLSTDFQNPPPGREKALSGEKEA